MVDENPAHFNALRMLIKLEFQLNRSPKTIQNYINRLLKFLPKDAECMEWLNNIRALESVNQPLPPSELTKTRSEKKVPKQKQNTPT